MFDAPDGVADGGGDAGAEARRRLSRAAAIAAGLEHGHRSLVAALLDMWPSSAWLAAGCSSAKKWLLAYTPLAEPDARRLLGIAELCWRKPRVADAFFDGRLSVAQATVLARAATSQRCPYLTDAIIDALLGVADHPDPSAFATAVSFWVDHVDQELELDRAPTHAVYLSQRLFGGGEIHGSLAEAAFARVAAALEAFLPDPDPVNAPWRRTLGQRRADALDDLAGFALSHSPDTTDPEDIAGTEARDDAATEGGTRRPDWEHDEWRNARTDEQPEPERSGAAEAGRPPHTPRTKPRSGVCVNVHMDLATVLGVRDPDQLAGLVLRGDGWRLTQRAAQELACDTALVATLFAGRTRVLDANTATERFSAAQRRALAARDGGCAFPGCGRHPRHCDAHHLHEHSRGGSTSVENGVVVCRFHHRLIHHQHWRLERDPDTDTWVAIDKHGTRWKGRPTHQNAA